jgi:hypothetical protein
MEFPKHIQSFMLHDVRGKWKYKGNELVSAHYIRVGSRMDMYIRTLADKSGELQYLIQLRDSYISGIETLEEAISIAEEVIEENELFIEK